MLVGVAMVAELKGDLDLYARALRIVVPSDVQGANLAVVLVDNAGERIEPELIEIVEVCFAPGSEEQRYRKLQLVGAGRAHLRSG
jgi:hypothetical protein